MKFFINQHIISSPYSNELMIYDSLLNKYYLIKGNGKEIFTLINEGKSVNEICSSLSDLYGNDLIIEKEVMKFIYSMEEKKIIKRE
ncbi:PqqD family protein [uncultured Polaribacter sp.]|uniref:PqqD family protein n=1 Tax=uncultured Polaribacter sp. TaxID=174711 RepID=UPI00259B0D0C|nr:PqqD family protein [uncultured Polaribacter sp.]